MTRWTADQAAPDFERPDFTGRRVRLSALTASGRRVALVFLRYIGCPVCQMRFWELDRRRGDYEALGAELMVVVQSDAARLAEYHRAKPFSLIVLPDADKTLYDLYGVGRATWGQYAAPAALKSALKATFSGHLHGRFDGDERQLPGDFVIDSDGRFLMTRVGEHIADNADDALLLDTLRAAAGR